MEYVRLGDICTKVCSGGTPTSSNPAYYDGDIPWLNTNEVNFCNIYSTNKTISEEGLRKSAAKYVPANTVIVAMYGVTAGKCAVAKIPLTTNQACCNLVINDKLADYRYVYHFLYQQSDSLNKLAVGGAQQNLNAITIKKFKIALPPLPTQQKIASILSTYDTLIENNTKRIRLLEQMAENLYKEWFVRLRFPGHENVEMENGLPKGWKIAKFGDLSPIITGKKDANFATSNGRYKFFTCSKEPLATDSYSFDCFAIILAGNGDLNVKLYDGQFEAYQRTYVLFPYDLKYIYISYYTIEQELDRLLVGAAGAVIKFLTKGMIENIKVFVPTEDILTDFNAIIENNYKERKILKTQNQLLIRQRDLLLPRLMSGKLEVTP